MDGVTDLTGVDWPFGGVTDLLGVDWPLDGGGGGACRFRRVEGDGIGDTPRLWEGETCAPGGRGAGRFFLPEVEVSEVNDPERWSRDRPGGSACLRAVGLPPARAANIRRSRVGGGGRGGFSNGLISRETLAGLTGVDC